jgi:hypothetical protein
MIENMSGFTCPHCNEIVDIFGSGGGERTAGSAGIEFLGRIPLDQKMVECGDEGKSYQEMYADSAVTKAFSDIAEKVGTLASAG